MGTDCKNIPQSDRLVVRTRHESQRVGRPVDVRNASHVCFEGLLVFASFGMPDFDGLVGGFPRASAITMSLSRLVATRAGEEPEGETYSNWRAISRLD